MKAEKRRVANLRAGARLAPRSACPLLPRARQTRVPEQQT